MKTEHTPKPWKISETDEEGHYVIESEDGKTAICYGAGFYGENNPSEANAHLISAAPDLLEALKSVVAIADRKTDEFDRARSAIAKAEGLQNESQ